MGAVSHLLCSFKMDDESLLTVTVYGLGNRDFKESSPKKLNPPTCKHKHKNNYPSSCNNNSVACLGSIPGADTSKPDNGNKFILNIEYLSKSYCRSISVSTK